MTIVELSNKERKLLEEIAKSTTDAAQLRRTQAIILLNEGIDIDDIEQLLFVSRKTIYKWAKQYQERVDKRIIDRVSEGIRSGRPGVIAEIIDPLIEEIIMTNPQEFGYNATIWTAPLLKHHFQEVHQISVSENSIRLSIERLKIRWKRPRHQLALRPKTWRQAKGGLKEG